jgi:hypothetical protein
MQESANNNSTIDNTAISIRSIPDGFAFYTSATKGDVYKELKMPASLDFPSRFEDFVKSEGWAVQNDLLVTVIDFPKHFMVLPNGITDKEQIKTFFNFQFLHEEENQIFSVPLSDGKQSFCWEMPSTRYNAFKRLFLNLNINSSACLLTDWAIHQASVKQVTTLVAHLYGKDMHLFVANTNGLLFANTFPIRNLEEMPYFFLRCMEQLSLNPIQTRCTICSESVPEQNIFEILHPYIQQIRFATFTNQKDYPLKMTGNKY